MLYSVVCGKISGDYSLRWKGAHNSDKRCAACMAFSQVGKRGTMLNSVKSKLVSKSKKVPVES